MVPVSHNYKQVNFEENFPFDSSSEHLRLPPSSRPKASTVILSITTFIFALLSLFLSQTANPGPLCIASASPSNPTIFQNGYDTEWDPPKAAIDIQKVTYTSAFRYNATDGTYYREFDPNTPQYVGNPSPEIDRAWMDLLAGQYLVLSEEEAILLHDPVAIKGMYLGE